jgi:hypothetical protein
MAHECNHEGDIGAIKATLSRIEKDLNGNGQQGIIQRFVIMEAEHTEVKENLDKLATAFSALAKNDSNKEAIRLAIANGLKRFGGFIAIGATILGAIYLILDHI